MISGVSSSSYLSYTSSPSSTTASANSKKFQQDLFSYLDSDGSGSVSSDELKTALSNTDTTADSSKVFAALDTNKDGKVSLDELSSAMQASATPPPSTQNDNSDQLFSLLDADGNGSIDSSELSSALSSASASASSSSNSSSTDQSTTDAKQAAATALSKMIAALSQRYDTGSNSTTVGKHLNVAT